MILGQRREKRVNEENVKKKVRHYARTFRFTELEMNLLPAVDKTHTSAPKTAKLINKTEAPALLAANRPSTRSQGRKEIKSLY